MTAKIFTEIFTAMWIPNRWITLRECKIIRDENGKLPFVPKLNENGEPLSDSDGHKTSNAESS